MNEYGYHRADLIIDFFEDMQIAHEAAARALAAGDDETAFHWMRQYHRLASRCLGETGIELRSY